MYEHKGEWYKYDKINDIVNIIYNDYNGILNMPTTDDYTTALNWCNELQQRSKKVFETDLL